MIPFPVSPIRIVPLLALLLAFGPGPGPHPASASPATPLQFQDELVLGDFDAPVTATLLPDGRIFIVEQSTAQVRLVVKGTHAAIDPAGTIPLVRAGGEAGLLGIAVDPGFPGRPYVYVQGTLRSPNAVRILRYTLTGDLAFTGNGAMALDLASQFTVIGNLPDASPKHNGGTLAFGPDGMLYSGVGDDENACRAQDPTKLQGKILRLDVSNLPAGAGGPPPYAAITPPNNPFVAHPDSAARLVWALGLRNPFSFTIDAATGCLHISDVGNEAWEEVDIACGGGLNFGWPLYEGNQRSATTCAGFDTSGFTPPEVAYPHVGQGYSIMSGPVYRAPAGATLPFPAVYEGTHFYGDTWKGFVRRLEASHSGWSPAPPVSGQPTPADWATGITWITSMHVGQEGSLYYTMLYRVEPVSGPGELRRIRYIEPSVGVGDPAPAGAGLALAAGPSPARSGRAIELTWRQAAPAPVTLRLRDVRGRIVRVLVAAADGVRAIGPHRAAWDGRAADGSFAAPGVYVATLETGGLRASVRVVRL